jgi:hypothetical protein
LTLGEHSLLLLHALQRQSLDLHELSDDALGIDAAGQASKGDSR